MRTYRLALIGFGNVGQGFTQILQEREAQLASQFGARFQIVAVSDLRRGALFDPGGLDATRLLDAARSGERLERVPAPHHGWDALRTIRESNADAIVELSFTDLETGEPALTHLRAAFEQGRHVVTSNKGPVALHYQELQALARANGVELGVEGTVMSGTPSLRLGQELLGAAGIRQIQGILNGTTNYILSQMEEGASYEQALADAQALGYAEADPTGDVEGYDATGKVVILANLLMNLPIRMADVERRGISALSEKDIAEARAAGECWKLIGSIRHEGGSAHCRVAPERLPLTHPLASVRGATNAITFSTELLGEVTLVGPGAGRLETGYAILGDLLAIHQRVTAG